MEKLIILLAIFLACVAYAESQDVQRFCYETKSYQERRVRYYYVECGWNHRHWRAGYHWHHRSCCRSQNYYVTIYYRVKKCCNGWSGIDCSVPICNPPCQAGGLCYQPDKCYCPSGSTGSTCGMIECSHRTNCWPGTCINGGTCRCAAGYGGNNCENTNIMANFPKCSVKMYNNDKLVLETPCYASDDPRDRTRFISERDITKFTVAYEAEYQIPKDYPHPPPYLKKSVEGIVRTWITVHFRDENGNNVNPTSTIKCNNPVKDENPHLKAVCEEDIKWTQPTKHGYSFEVRAHARTGGFKTLHDQNGFTLYNNTFVGADKYRTVKVGVDLERPVHCTDNGTCTDNDEPLSIGGIGENEDDITSQNNISIAWSGWSDQMSGLGNFNVEIFSMQDFNGHLRDQKPALFSRLLGETDVLPIVYFPKEPGMYSIMLTAFDTAGNPAVARRLVLWDNSSQISIKQENNNKRTMYVDQAEYHHGFYWVTNLTRNSENRRFTLHWTGHFENSIYGSKKLLYPVEADSKINYEDNAGQRTLQAIQNKNGIIYYEWAYMQVDGELDESLYKGETLDETTTFDVTLSSEGMVRFFVRATDPIMNMVPDNITVYVDETGPRLIGTPSYSKDAVAIPDHLKNNDNFSPYLSAVTLIAMDEESGLSHCEYTVNDETVRAHTKRRRRETTTVSSQSVEIPILSKTREECLVSNDCHCDRMGQCFDRNQLLYINNCWMKDREGHDFSLEYTIYNRAGSAAPTGNIQLGTLNNLPGLDSYPAPSEVSKTDDYDKYEGIQISWSQPGACFKVTSFTLELSGGETTRVDSDKRSFIFSNLYADTDYTGTIVAHYDLEGEQSPKFEFKFRTNPLKRRVQASPGDGAPPPSSSSGLSTGAIIGVVIGVLILLLLVGVIVLMVVRRGKGEPMVPKRVNEVGRTIRDRISRHSPDNNYAERTEPTTNGHHDNLRNHNISAAYANPAYTTNNVPQNEDDEMYLYGSKTLSGSWEVEKNHIKLGNTIATGRFAELKVANVVGHKDPLAAKMLKPGHSSDDKILMKAKMNFFVEEVIKHHNLANFIGGVPDSNIILLEYCSEGRLNDWLRAIIKVTDDREDQMIKFSLHIADGVDYLHTKGVLHRRLAARNVLVANEGGTLTAKLIGFGPMRGEHNGANNQREKVPLKWMAPEVMDVGTNGKRMYSKASDVWSYGVVMWEIFTLGKSPWESTDASRLKKKLEGGERLERPDYCFNLYDEIQLKCWNYNPSARPLMSDIATSLAELFGGGAGAGEQYYMDG